MKKKYPSLRGSTRPKFCCFLNRLRSLTPKLGLNLTHIQSQKLLQDSIEISMALPFAAKLCRGASFSGIFLPHGFRKFRKKISENHDFGHH
jgi:hypothetical protein